MTTDIDAVFADLDAQLEQMLGQKLRKPSTRDRRSKRRRANDESRSALRAIEERRRRLREANEALTPRVRRSAAEIIADWPSDQCVTLMIVTTTCTNCGASYDHPHTQLFAGQYDPRSAGHAYAPLAAQYVPPRKRRTIRTHQRAPYCPACWNDRLNGYDLRRARQLDLFTSEAPPPKQLRKAPDLAELFSPPTAYEPPVGSAANPFHPIARSES